MELGNTELQQQPKDKVVVAIFSLTALVAILGVPLYGILYGYDAIEWTVFAFFMIFTGISITAGYHRLWAHKAYKAHALLRTFFAIWGAGALQNTVLEWAAHHRTHHQHIDDDEKDPYSITRGFWFAHIGWMLPKNPAKSQKNVKDLLRDPVVIWQNKYHIHLILGVNIGLPVLLGWMNGDILGMFLLAGVLRLVLTHHFTWFINSLAHMWGRRPYNKEISARDNDFLALFTWGEGYHNYHHHFQWDYRNGIKWWNYDPSKWLIFTCSKIGLASDLKRVPDEKIQAAVEAQKSLNLSGQTNTL